MSTKPQGTIATPFRMRLLGDLGFDILCFAVLGYAFLTVLNSGAISVSYFYCIQAGLLAALSMLLATGRAPGSKSAAVRRAVLTFGVGALVGITTVLNVPEPFRLGFGEAYLSAGISQFLFIALTAYLPAAVLASAVLRGLYALESKQSGPSR